MMRWIAVAGLVAMVAAGCAKSLDEGAGIKRLPPSPVQRPVATQVTNLHELQKYHARAVVHPQPWAGYWWPYVGSGIASSWRDPQGLSPADKFDLAYFEYLKAHDKPLDKYERLAPWERARHGPGLPNVANWWGHCNGWAAAALMVPEPREPKVIHGVTFDVRDQKALLAESWMEFSGDFVGTRVNVPGDFSSAAFWDIVPAQFHLLLTNMVGRQNRGIILDRHSGDEVWNHPLVAYEIEPVTNESYLGAHPEYPNIHRVNMTARIWWANDNVHPDAITPKFEFERLREEFYDEFFPGRKLHYELWLDGPVEFDESGAMTGSGNILVARADDVYVGGVWKNAAVPASLVHTHPDYMWIPFGLQNSSGYKNPRLDDAWVRDHVGGRGN